MEIQTIKFVILEKEEVLSQQRTTVGWGLIHFLELEDPAEKDGAKYRKMLTKNQVASHCY